MATIPWPSVTPGAWEVLFLGGVVFPGLAFVKVSGGQKIDVKDAPGADGESTTQQGEKAKSVDITLRLWLSEHWDEIEDVFKIIEPPIGKRTPLDIVTAATAFRLITSIVVEDIQGPNWDARSRWMEYTIKAREHRPSPPKSATAKNTASVSRPGFGNLRLAESTRLGGGETNGRLLIGQATESASSGFARPGA